MSDEKQSKLSMAISALASKTGTGKKTDAPSDSSGNNKTLGDGTQENQSNNFGNEDSILNLDDEAMSASNAANENEDKGSNESFIKIGNAQRVAILLVIAVAYFFYSQSPTLPASSTSANLGEASTSTVESTDSGHNNDATLQPRSESSSDVTTDFEDDLFDAPDESELLVEADNPLENDSTGAEAFITEPDSDDPISEEFEQQAIDMQLEVPAEAVANLDPTSHTETPDDHVIISDDGSLFEVSEKTPLTPAITESNPTNFDEFDAPENPTPSPVQPITQSQAISDEKLEKIRQSITALKESIEQSQNQPHYEFIEAPKLVVLNIASAAPGCDECIPHALVKLNGIQREIGSGETLFGYKVDIIGDRLNLVSDEHNILFSYWVRTDV